MACEEMTEFNLQEIANTNSIKINQKNGSQLRGSYGKMHTAMNLKLKQ